MGNCGSSSKEPATPTALPLSTSQAKIRAAKKGQRSGSQRGTPPAVDSEPGETEQIEPAVPDAGSPKVRHTVTRAIDVASLPTAVLLPTRSQPALPNDPAMQVVVWPVPVPAESRGALGAPSSQYICIVVPNGRKGGDPLGIRFKGGRTERIRIPAGLQPGDEFVVSSRTLSTHRVPRAGQLAAAPLSRDQQVSVYHGIFGPNSYQPKYYDKSGRVTATLPSTGVLSGAALVAGGLGGGLF